MIKIAILGIGGVGGYYGGRLAHAFEGSNEVEISFVARGAHLEAIRTNGLIVHGREVDFVAHPAVVDSDPAAIGIVDYLFVATKGYDLESAMVNAAPMIGPSTVIIPLLNGLGIAERISKIYPANECWWGCVFVVSYIEQPGVIRENTNGDQMAIGPVAPSERVEPLRQVLTESGIRFTISDTVQQTVWEKVILISSAATLTSFYNVDYGEMLGSYLSDYKVLLAEIATLAFALKAPVSDDIVRITLDRSAYVNPINTTSMNKDFRSGRSTELELLTGSILRMGQEIGVAMPLYERMYKALLERT